MKKWYKANILNFYGKPSLSAKWGMFSPKINILGILSKSVSQAFLKFYLMTGSKKRIKWLFFILGENFHYAQNWGNESVLGPNSTSFKSISQVFLKLFLTTGIKKWTKKYASTFEGKIMLCSVSGHSKGTFAWNFQSFANCLYLNCQLTTLAIQIFFVPARKCRR